MVKISERLDAQGTNKYDDIINIEYPLKKSDVFKHPKMPIKDRAKIFAPFAALKGHEEAIAAKEKIVVPRIELSEESKEYLDLQLRKIEGLLMNGKHPMITVVYFQKNKVNKTNNEETNDYGEYIQFTGMVAKFDWALHVLQIVEKRLRLENIYGIEGEELDAI